MYKQVPGVKYGIPSVYNSSMSLLSGFTCCLIGDNDVGDNVIRHQHRFNCLIPWHAELKSNSGYQFVGCRKNMGNGTTKHKGWYEDNEGTVFYPSQQRCRKVQCPSAKKEFVKSLSREDKQSLYVSWKYHIWEFHRTKFSKIMSFSHFWLAYFLKLIGIRWLVFQTISYNQTGLKDVTLWHYDHWSLLQSRIALVFFSSVQPCYYGIHGPTTVVLPYWPSFGFINAVFGVDHYWVMNIRICLFTLDLICRVFDPK